MMLKMYVSAMLEFFSRFWIFFKKPGGTWTTARRHMCLNLVF